MFSKYIKKITGISQAQERLVYWILIVAQAALSIISKGMINVKYFDVVYDINKVAIRYAEDKSWEENAIVRKNIDGVSEIIITMYPEYP